MSWWFDDAWCVASASGLSGCRRCRTRTQRAAGLSSVHVNDYRAGDFVSLANQTRRVRIEPMHVRLGPEPGALTPRQLAVAGAVALYRLVDSEAAVERV